MNSSLSEPKNLLYVTTHMSELHRLFLKHCWAKAIQNSELLQKADVLIYSTNPIDQSDRILLENTFGKERLRIRRMMKPILAIPGSRKAKQEGAISAMTSASEHGDFKGYEWVIRLNPDVIIQDDAWMLDVMKNDIEAMLLYSRCKSEEDMEDIINTDFFILRTGRLPTDIFLDNHGEDCAERIFTKQMGQIFQTGAHRHIPGVSDNTGTCRVTSKILDDPGSAPVVHYHDKFHDYEVEMAKTLTCPATFHNL